jgi:hypothetical protein
MINITHNGLQLDQGLRNNAMSWGPCYTSFLDQYYLVIPDLPLHNSLKDMKLETANIDTRNILRHLVKSITEGGQARIVSIIRLRMPEN